MWSKFRHKVVYTLLRPVFFVYLRIRYGYHAKKSNFGKGPAIILFNHPTNLDPFMVAISFKEPIYFMASDHLFSMKFVSPIIRYLVAPIPKKKSSKDLQAIKDSIKLIKEGAKISLSPEGNRTYSGQLNYVNPAIVKLVRHLKVPLLLYTIVGGYGINPRFSTILRWGKSFGEVKRVVSVDEVEKMTDEELYKLIIKTLSVYDLDHNIKFKSKKKAEQMESLFYVCPVCEGRQTLSSKGNHLKCSKCALDVEYTEKLTFKTSNPKFTFKTVYDWYIYQEDFARSLEIEVGKIFFSDSDVLLMQIIKNKRTLKLFTGKLTADFEKFVIENNDNRREFKYDDISSAAVLGHNKLRFYVGDDIYQFKSDDCFNALKYLHLYYHINYLKKGDTNEFNSKYLGI